MTRYEPQLDLESLVAIDTHVHIELGEHGHSSLPGDLAEALRANTMVAAYQIGLEQKTGSVEVGKFADLVLLEKNLFEAAPHDIHKTKVLMTVMNGQITHELGT